jgi:hypothetical protein
LPAFNFFKNKRIKDNLTLFYTLFTHSTFSIKIGLT